MGVNGSISHVLTRLLTCNRDGDSFSDVIGYLAAAICVIGFVITTVSIAIVLFRFKRGVVKVLPWICVEFIFSLYLLMLTLSQLTSLCDWWRVGESVLLLRLIHNAILRTMVVIGRQEMAANALVSSVTLIMAFSTATGIQIIGHSLDLSMAWEAFCAVIGLEILVTVAAANMAASRNGPIIANVAHAAVNTCIAVVLLADAIPLGARVLVFCVCVSIQSILMYPVAREAMTHSALDTSSLVTETLHAIAAPSSPPAAATVAQPRKGRGIVNEGFGSDLPLQLTNVKRIGSLVDDSCPSPTGTGRFEPYTPPYQSGRNAVTSILFSAAGAGPMSGRGGNPRRSVSPVHHPTRPPQAERRIVVPRIVVHFFP